MQHLTTEVSLRYADKVEFLRPCEENLVEDLDVSVLQAVYVVGGRGRRSSWRHCCGRHSARKSRCKKKSRDDERSAQCAHDRVCDGIVDVPVPCLLEELLKNAHGVTRMMYELVLQLWIFK